MLISDTKNTCPSQSTLVEPKIVSSFGFAHTNFGFRSIRVISRLHPLSYHRLHVCIPSPFSKCVLFNWA